jgi:hypothetical protein
LGAAIAMGRCGWHGADAFGEDFQPFGSKTRAPQDRRARGGCFIFERVSRRYGQP